MPTLYILIGPPACGKSTFAKLMRGYDLGTIVSSDQVRKQLYGDESVQKDHAKVFAICHNKIKDAIADGQDVIFDATNTAPNHRNTAMDVARDAGADQIVGIMYNGTLEKCLENNRNRDRQVPEEVIRRLYDDMYRFEPKLSDVFDELIPLR